MTMNKYYWIVLMTMNKYYSIFVNDYQ